LELWAINEDVDLELIDDTGNGLLVGATYKRFLDTTPIVIGPYGSNLVRRVAELDRDDRLIWNHGGSADDLPRRGIVSLPAPASTYLRKVVDVAAMRGLERIQIVRGRGRFAASVATGVIVRAMQLGVDHRFVDSFPAPSAVDAWVVVGRYREDVDVVRSLVDRGPGLIACVGAGLKEFEADLGRSAEGVIGAVQWLPNQLPSGVGPTAQQFSALYRDRYGEEPSYIAAQAAAAGYLAAEAYRRQFGLDDIRNWHTTSLYGPFALDSRWRQIAHRVTLVEWRNGEQRPIG
jgi:hypothetical protein